MSCVRHPSFGASGDRGGLCHRNKTVIPGSTPFAAHATGGVEMPRESAGLRSPLPGLPSMLRSDSGVSSDAGDVEAASSGVTAQPHPSPASRSASHAGGLADGKRRRVTVSPPETPKETSAEGSIDKRSMEQFVDRGTRLLKPI